MENASDLYNNIVQYLRLNYLNLGLTFLFLVAGFFIANFIKRRIRLRLIKRSPNHITATFISQITGFTLKSIIVLITLYLLGLDAFTNKVLAGAGLLTFVIGFALKDIGENFLAGIILAFKSPFRLDDLIEINNIEGFVKDINIRETLIKTPDGKDVFLPNSIILKNPLFNYTIDGFLRYEFTVGIAYENNPTDAIKIILETVNNVEGVLKGDKKPSISIRELATNTININVQFWVDTFKTSRRSVHHSIRSQIMNNVIAALIAKGFSLPASIVELKNYDPPNTLNLKINENE
ncbi:mechanosensitive ion channel family protein [Salegentibacter sp. JZCK2]|uniref:mechanosensitive ion channel family protein n=1 Tax=Salegentibacter tibetensis TaxID=2873600 RepID=UPI001CCF319E|nr:mechanosensitive ion channel domain-containing protein [Salegentibacter tibetensis]MBZ9729293.1 mechanosensitive ion channel family protein [Salegentibacter tibetensis]